MKRPLFVFAGQSNMMGASVYPASKQVYFENSAEYLHKARRLGSASGCFKKYGFPCGEFSYKDILKAYGENQNPSIKSNLDNYTLNTYFCPSMCNLASEEKKTTYPFDYYSEASAKKGVCMAPYIVKGLEDAGYASAYTHIAKGSVGIEYFIEGAAADYFDKKVTDFFEDCELAFDEDDTSERVLFWMQGENDGTKGYEYYKSSLNTLWIKAKALGFTKFFIIRAGYWGEEEIVDVMRAQEDFCRECKDAFLLTRVGSYFEYVGQKSDEWFKNNTPMNFSYCRDSFYGFPNQHINEKGFKIIAQHAVPNIVRVLFEGKEPVLEEENILRLIQ